MTTGSVVGRIIAGIVSAATGLFWLAWIFVVVSSRFSTDLASDPHGFGMIFGTLLAAFTGLLFIAALPFALPRERRAQVGGIAGASYVIVTVLLFAAWFTA